MLNTHTAQLPETDRCEISVVIPTRGRPQLLKRAILSVLAQTHQNFEIVVVMDGPDKETATAIKACDDKRIRVLTLPESAGGAVARNAGVATAHGRWIAFLDDDDEFCVEKLELQLQAAVRHGSMDRTLTVCKATVVSGTGVQIWPRRFPAPGERIVDYLFCRTDLRQGEAFLQSSTYFVSRALALHVPFREDLRRHQDWDWLLQLQKNVDLEIVAVPLALAIYHRDEGMSLSRQSGWSSSLHWAMESVLPESPKAYSFFVATQCVTRLGAEQCWRWDVLRCLTAECFRKGRGSVHAALLFACFWLRALSRSIGMRVRPHIEPKSAKDIDSTSTSVSSLEN